MTKKYDMAVKTGSYKDKDGMDKNRYETIGGVHSSKNNDGHFAVLNTVRILGIAQMAIARGDDSVMVSLFQPQNHSHVQPPDTQAAPENFDDDIPF